jgi:hypothetical protein
VCGYGFSLGSSGISWVLHAFVHGGVGGWQGGREGGRVGGYERACVHEWVVSRQMVHYFFFGGG